MKRHPKREGPRYPDLRSWREAKGLTSAEAAEALGLSQTTYSRFERRVRATKGPTAKRLQILTDVPLDVLTGAAS